MRCADKGEKAAGMDNCDYIYMLNGIFAAYPFMNATLTALARAFNEAPTGRPVGRLCALAGESLAMRAALPMICR